MQHSYGYEVGDVVYLFRNNWGEGTAERFTVTRLTPGGQMVMTDGKREERVNKNGTVIGYDGWRRPYVLRREEQEERYVRVLKEVLAKRWKHKLKDITDELLRNPTVETAEQLLSHVRTQPKEP